MLQMSNLQYNKADKPFRYYLKGLICFFEKKFQILLEKSFLYT